jgi:hypothetical protein
MPVSLTCKHCSKSYFVPPSRAKESNYCGRSCADAGRSLQESLIKCASCGEAFAAKSIGGNSQKYCSRSCYLAGCVRSETRSCASCGNEFIAKASSSRIAAGEADQLTKYCSRACSDAGKRTGSDYKCANCGVLFYASRSRLRELGDSGCCSASCQAEYFVGARNKMFKGWKWQSSADGVVHVRMEAGRGGVHLREHRVIVARALGRQLEATEVVLHINNNNSDNRLENLYLCRDKQEAGKILGGSKPWPTASNIP